MQDESQRSEGTVGNEDTPITVGPIRVDRSHLQVSVDGKSLSLTAMESRCLHFLAAHANTVCTNKQIVSYVWGYNDENTSLLKAYIRHLRQKIEPDPMHPIYLLTISEGGYMLVSHDQDETKQKTSMDADV